MSKSNAGSVDIVIRGSTALHIAKTATTVAEKVISLGPVKILTSRNPRKNTGIPGTAGVIQGSILTGTVAQDPTTEARTATSRKASLRAEAGKTTTVKAKIATPETAKHKEILKPQ